jgi:DNA-binding protein H-NS
LCTQSRRGHADHQAELEALRVAGEKMQELIEAAGTTEDEIVADFKRARRERRMRKG